MSILEDITDKDPCGIDYKYDDEYISIELEIEKNFNVSSAGETQWDIVILKCENVLSNHSKDLKILSYWLYAQWNLNGWFSFLSSLENYTGVIEKYTNALFPHAEKRKVKIFEWLENVLEDLLIKEVETLSKDDLIKLSGIFERLERSVSVTITDEYTLFKELSLVCNNTIQRLNANEEAEKKQEEYQKQEALRRAAEHEALSEAEKTRREEEEEILSKFSSNNSFHGDTTQLEEISCSDIDIIQTTLVPLSESLLKKSPRDFIGYKVLFSLGEILLGEALRDSSIQLDDFIPSNDIINVTRRLEEGSVNVSQLEALIEQLILRPTWMEGYYIIAKILYKLSYTKDAMQVESMLFYFLSKEEKILEIQINGDKFIPEHIVSWMQTKLLALNNSDNSAIEYQHTYQEVMKIKNEENAKNALAVLEEHYQKAKGEESRFRWRLLMVDFALEIGDKKLALSLLYELEHLIEIYKINIWQPTLAVNVYEILLKPMFTQELGAENKERIYRKLSILDVQKVIKL